MQPNYGVLRSKMEGDFVVRSIGHVLQNYDFSSSLVEQSNAISEDTDEYDISLICFVNKLPNKIEKTSMFTSLIDKDKAPVIDKEMYVGVFGGLRIRISFYDEPKYDEIIKNDPLSFDSVVIMYNSKIIFDKTTVMTKNHKLVNKGGKKLRKTEVIDKFCKTSKKVEHLERSYRDDDVVYFFSLCEQIKEEFTSLLFAMNGKPFFSFRNLSDQIETLDVAPDDYYSNILLATQFESVEKKILIFKRLSSSLASLIGIDDVKEEFVSVKSKKKKTDDFDLRRIVEQKIKSVSATAKPLKRKAIDDFKVNDDLEEDSEGEEE